MLHEAAAPTISYCRTELNSSSSQHIALYTLGSNMAPLHIVIVGAGIGGLVAAAGLARNGHRVTVYERLSSATEIGYAFRITANSDRCLKLLGIDNIAGGAVVANSSRIFSAQGEVIFEFKENSDTEKAKRGTSVFAYRVMYFAKHASMSILLTFA